MLTLRRTAQAAAPARDAGHRRVLTLGIVLVVYAVTGLQHLSDPSQYGPAGGAKNFRGGLGV